MLIFVYLLKLSVYLFICKLQNGFYNVIRVNVHSHDFIFLRARNNIQPL